MKKRTLGTTEIEISPVALGCWPISGMTSIEVNDQDSVATIEAALSHGVNFLDTAYMYGADGESEKLIAQVVRSQREQVVIATKGGLHWNQAGQRVLNARPERIRQECEESLSRLQTNYIDLLYLHAPDPTIPVSESAGAYRELLKEGKTRSVGVSNLTVEQMEEFARECPITAVQPPYNMLQRDIEADLLPWCQQRNISVIVYWPLMKGLLAGKLARDHVFPPEDGRAKYPMFHGDEWQKNQDFVDALRDIANAINKTVAQVVINWTIHQPGITAALCGAKRASQAEANAGAMGWQLSQEHLDQIDVALAKRGTAITRSPV